VYVLHSCHRPTSASSCLSLTPSSPHISNKLNLHAILIDVLSSILKLLNIYPALGVTCSTRSSCVWNTDYYIVGCCATASKACVFYTSCIDINSPVTAADDPLVYTWYIPSIFNWYNVLTTTTVGARKPVSKTNIPQIITNGYVSTSTSHIL
jgi:hypothetical protein